MSTSVLGAKGESKIYIKYNPLPQGVYGQEKHPWNKFKKKKKTNRLN